MLFRAQAGRSKEKEEKAMTEKERCWNHAGQRMRRMTTIRNDELPSLKELDR
jgi:hypothetical protein